MNSLDLKVALANEIVGQKRTGKHKQFVFLIGQYAYKGPYQQGRLDNVISRSQIFQAWNTPCIVRALDHIPGSEGRFVRFPNIMTGYQLETEMHRESFSELQYRILKNPPIFDIGHAIPSNPWIPSEAENLILALCHCNILGVGDTNVRNTLVNPTTHEFFIIDIDDNLGTDRDDEVFYFSKPPAKKLLWYERVSSHYNTIADKLTHLATDPIILERKLTSRLERVISLLRRHARVFILRNNKAEPYYASTDQTREIQPITQNLANPERVMTLKIENRVGEMVWKGLRGGVSKTFSGIDLDIAKSALQKYIRRNETTKAIMTAVELYRLGEVGGDPGVSNMYNRLAIIANEDIGAANVSLVLEVTRLVESGDRDLSRLAAMVQLLAESPKTRIMSHAWRAYAHPQGRIVSAKLGLILDASFTDADREYVTQNIMSDLFMPGDPEVLKPYILIFLKRLQERNFNAFTWAYFFLSTVRTSPALSEIDDSPGKCMTIAKRRKFINGNTRCTTGKADILLWKALAKCLPAETHDVLVGAYYNHTESRPFLQNAIILALYGLPYAKFDMEPFVKVWREAPVLQEMLGGNFHLEVDEYVIDKHTNLGRQRGMGTKEFVEEGALVIPQSPLFYNDILAEIYRTR